MATRPATDSPRARSPRALEALPNLPPYPTAPQPGTEPPPPAGSSQGRPGEPPDPRRVSLHCTDEEPEEEEPHRCSQRGSPEAAAGCPGPGGLRDGAESRPHRSGAAPRLAPQRPPRRPKSRRWPAPRRLEAGGSRPPPAGSRC